MLTDGLFENKPRRSSILSIKDFSSKKIFFLSMDSTIVLWDMFGLHPGSQSYTT